MISAFKILVSLFAVACLAAPRVTLENGDWPQHLADAGRSAYTPMTLAPDLGLLWTRAGSRPDPAWTGPDSRKTDDYAPGITAAGSLLFFGSSADGRLFAINTKNGEEEWTFFTQAPVRFAPLAWRDLVLVQSDDGFVYALRAKSGKLIWKKRGGPDSLTMLGNGHLISAWPVRGGMVERGDTLYFGAGIWPSQGVYVHAVDPATGRTFWVNDSMGPKAMAQPHKGAWARSGVAAQGYLALSGGRLLAPTGRGAPAAFNASTGAFDYFHLQKMRNYGGTTVSATQALFFIHGAYAMDLFDPEVETRAPCFSQNGLLASADEIRSPVLALSPDRLYYVDRGDGDLKAQNLATLFNPDVKQNEMVNSDKEIISNAPRALAAAEKVVALGERQAISLLIAGTIAVVGTAEGRILVVDLKTREKVRSFRVDGVPHVLAAAHGRLFVSTDQGTLYGFGEAGSGKSWVVGLPALGNPFGDNTAEQAAAREILAQYGSPAGFCVDVACGDGALAFELARLSEMSIIAIAENETEAALARKRLVAAGVYGGQVMVVDRSLPITRFIADLAVSGESVRTGVQPSALPSALRPGGLMLTGRPGALQKIRAPALSGGGQWTHQYADPANTLNSRDNRVEGPFRILWFDESPIRMPSRHGRGPSPLFADGRLHVQGVNGIYAVNAYNGLLLWRRSFEGLALPYDQDHLSGTAATHSNWCLSGDRIFLLCPPTPSKTPAKQPARYCEVLDGRDGEILAEWRIPQALSGAYGNYWGYLAVDQDLVFGTAADVRYAHKWAYKSSDMGRLFSESRALFALDAKSGEAKWSFIPRHSIRHNAIAIGDGRLFLIDRPQSSEDRLFDTAAPGPQAPGRLCCLEASTGKLLYETEENIFGTLLVLSRAHDILLMTYQKTRFALPSEKGGRLSAFKASTGKRLWDIVVDSSDNKYLSRPVLGDSVIYLEPFAYDLSTGRKLDFKLLRTHNCGIVTASEKLLAFRSSTLGYLDLKNPGAGVENVGGVRPGCWVNALPVGGLLLMPDATERCSCGYLNKTSVGLIPLSLLAPAGKNE